MERREHDGAADGSVVTLILEALSEAAGGDREHPIPQQQTPPRPAKDDLKHQQPTPSTAASMTSPRWANSPDGGEEGRPDDEGDEEDEVPEVPSFPLLAPTDDNETAAGTPLVSPRPKVLVLIGNEAIWAEGDEAAEIEAAVKQGLDEKEADPELASSFDGDAASPGFEDFEDALRQEFESLTEADLAAAEEDLSASENAVRELERHLLLERAHRDRLRLDLAEMRAAFGQRQKREAPGGDKHDELHAGFVAAGEQGRPQKTKGKEADAPKPNESENEDDRTRRWADFSESESNLGCEAVTAAVAEAVVEAYAKRKNRRGRRSGTKLQAKREKRDGASRDPWSR